MPAFIVENSSDGDLSSQVEIRASQRKSDIDETFNLDKTERTIADLFKSLPAAQQTEGSINFLGSSYSGVDLKVVAHLYDTVNWVEEKIAKQESKLGTAKFILDGINNLINGGLDGMLQQNILGNIPLTYSLRRKRFIAASGLQYPGGKESDRAVDLLLNAIFTKSNFTFLGVAQMKRQAIGLKPSFDAQVGEAQARLDNLVGLQDSGGGQSSDTVTLGTLQTISVQSFREKNAVRALGHSYAKGYTRGARTIGGSMIFTIFNEHALADLIRRMGNSRTYGERDQELTTLLPDQLPPIDLTLVFANEYGSLSDLRLYGVEFVTDGQVFSIEDLLSEGTMNFVCRDADMMTSKGQIRLSRLQRGMFNDKDDKDMTGSSLLFDTDGYQEYLKKLGVRRRLTGR